MASRSLFVLRSAIGAARTVGASRVFARTPALLAPRKSDSEPNLGPFELRQVDPSIRGEEKEPSTPPANRPHQANSKRAAEADANIRQGQAASTSPCSAQWNKQPANSDVARSPAGPYEGVPGAAKEMQEKERKGDRDSSRSQSSRSAPVADAPGGLGGGLGGFFGNSKDLQSGRDYSSAN
eukprot:TRINITY_DN1584_c0_g3_i1.p2 TRINITY_DN1584_c0_g3~~TRINITY_DN1584_c0_g3_i1.p2  ORF type:complete len:205 (-),score=18.97 TRINITY_DN1584_c0_g3_i1:193-735(-)